MPTDEAAENSSPEALYAFLRQCQQTAARSGRSHLVSITLDVDALDPLAVLESIFEPGERHFYVERPSENMALAGAEAVVAFTASGQDRFARCQRFIDDTLADALVVGDLSAPFAGPHFFTTFSFAEEAEPGEKFESACVFVPRWQVAVSAGRTTAVANLVIDAGTPLEALAGRLWRARVKFGAFDYAEPRFDAVPVRKAVEVSEVGSRALYEASVSEALAHIAEGRYRKIVLARAKDLVASAPFHPLQVLNGLRQRYPGCYAFSVANGHGQSLIGASPERLLCVRDGVVASEALAGSAPRGLTASEDAALAAALLRNEKELAEHACVLDSIVRRLSSLGLEPRHPAKPALRRLANVQHLHTPIHADVKASLRPLDLVARLHPTPAVGGSPREAAVSCIRKLESFPRGLYAGVLGWVDARGEGEFFVGLRSALIDGTAARLYAGAGIVAGSDPVREADETELKFAAMLSSLLSDPATGKQA